VHADGQHRLLVADAERKLKVFKGTGLQSEHALLDTPQAMSIFYDSASKPLIPCVAVAAGPFVFIHRGLRPYYKFALPKQDVHPQDKEEWEKMKTTSKIDPSIAATLMENLK
jgi:Bardet-Biedl syndrome 1 protein